MIGKGKPRGEGVKLAAYLLKAEPGERAELIQMQGFGSCKDLLEGFRREEIRAEGTKAEKPFFHVHFRGAEGEGKKLTPAQWLEIADRCDRAFGLAGQPGAASLHIDLKTGDRHMHIARSLVMESEDGRLYVKKLGLYKNTLKQLSREIELDYGLKVLSNERKPEHRARAADRREFEEGRRLGIDTAAIRSAILESFEKSDNGRSFAAAMKAHGFELANGDRRDCFVVIDPAGGQHALTKKLTGKTLEQIRDRLADLDRSQLPSVDQAKELQLVRQVEQEKRQGPSQTRDHGRDGDGPPNSPTPSHGPENGHSVDVKPPRDLGKTAGEIRMAWRLTDTGQQFAQEIENRGLALVYVSREEADTSHRTKAFAKAVNRQSRELKEGFAVVDRRGTVTRIDQRATGDLWEEIQKKLGGIQRHELMTVAHARAVMRDANRAEFLELKQGERFETKIVDAHKATAGDREKFSAELREGEQRKDKPRCEGFDIARVTAADVKAIDELREGQQFAAAADAADKRQHFGRVKEGELAAVTKSGDVFRLDPRHMAEIASSSMAFPSVLEMRQAFEIECSVAAEFRKTMVDIQLQRGVDAAAERVTAFQEQAANQEVRSVVNKVEAAATLPISGGGKLAEKVLDLASDALGAVIKPIEGAIKILGDIFSPAPAPTVEQLKTMKAGADEQAQLKADLAAYQQNEARRFEHITRSDEESQQHLTAPEYFRHITRHGPSRDDDGGRERERERER